MVVVFGFYCKKLNGKQYVNDPFIIILLVHIISTYHASINQGCDSWNVSIFCRRLEAKLDAKNLWSEAIAIRCAPPPAQRRVPIQFDAWIVVSETKKDENWFMTSQLVQDRRLLGKEPKQRLPSSC